MCCIMIKWKENYGFNNNGDSDPKKPKSMDDDGLFETMRKSMNVILNDKRILSIGIIQSGFESSLYIFVFMWTKVLDTVYFDGKHNKFDHGIVFAIMMISCFIGVSVVTIIRLKYNDGYNQKFNYINVLK